MAALRWIPVTSFWIALAGLALSFATLLAGITGNRPNAPAIATFNMSSLGLADYHNPSSPLFTNITSLVPSDVSNPPSITRYLGAKDWYTMHYFTNCSGYYAPSIINPTVLTSAKIDITCTRIGPSYVFNLTSTLASGLKPSVHNLAAGLSYSKVYNMSPWVSLWYTGMSTCFLCLMLLPYAFSGVRKRVSEKVFIDAGITFIFMAISSGLLTGHALGIHRSGAPLGPNPYPGAFLALTWSSTTCIVVVFCLMHLEWKYELWTPVGEPITRYSKPDGVSWWSMARYRRKDSQLENQLKTYQDDKRDV